MYVGFLLGRTSAASKSLELFHRSRFRCDAARNVQNAQSPATLKTLRPSTWSVYLPASQVVHAVGVFRNLKVPRGQALQV